MNLPVIETPVFPRWIWMEEITYSHIPIATIVTVFMILAPLFEYIGVRRNDLRWERLGRSFIWFSMILFSPGAALGTGIPMFIMGTYPEFWSRWVNLFFWPLIIQFIFFLAEVFFLFFMYYLTWDRWSNKKRLHISMGVCAAVCGYLVQIVWDSLGSYMMTPGGVALPQVAAPLAWSAKAMFNPSFGHLLIHRTFGNFSYVLLLTGGVLALRWMGQKRKNPCGENAVYFQWASCTCFTIGFFCFFAMPVIGWFYARVIQAEAPIAFMALMGGHSSVYFIIKMSLIVVVVTVGGTFVVKYIGTNTGAWSITAGMLIIFAVVWMHPPLMWIAGSASAWRVLSTAIILGFIWWIWRCKSSCKPQHWLWQWAMLVAGLAAFFAFTLGGFLREHIKNPDTVYGEIVKPEWSDFESDRNLMYEKWLLPRNEMPAELERNRPADWRKKVEQARQEGLVLTEEESEKIIHYLEENHQ